jgi:hypothetical protein
MDYKVTEGADKMEGVFSQLSSEDTVESYYDEKYEFTIYVNKSAGREIKYIPSINILRVDLKEKSKLLEKFNQLIGEKGVTLERIN